MGIEARDLFLISPELSLVALAAIVVLLDLVARRAGVAVVVGLVGLIVPFAAGIGLWNEVHAAGGAELGFNGSLVVDKFALYFKFLILGVLALVFLAGADHLKRFPPLRSGVRRAGPLLVGRGSCCSPPQPDLITLYVSLELALAARRGARRIREVTGALRRGGDEVPGALRDRVRGVAVRLRVHLRRDREHPADSAGRPDRQSRGSPWPATTGSPFGSLGAHGGRRLGRSGVRLQALDGPLPDVDARRPTRERRRPLRRSSR